MKRASMFWTLLLLLPLLSAVAQAEDVVKGFSFPTIAGKVLDYRSLRGTPMVVNIGSHW